MYCSIITMGTEKHSVEDKPQKKNKMRVREKKERIKTEINNNKKNVSNCTQTICPQVLESELVTDAKGPPFVIVFRQFKDVHDFHGIHELVTWIMNYILNSHCTVSDGRIDTSYRRTTFFFTASNITPTLWLFPLLLLQHQETKGKKKVVRVNNWKRALLPSDTVIITNTSAFHIFFFIRSLSL